MPGGRGAAGRKKAKRLVILVLALGVALALAIGFLLLRSPGDPAPAEAGDAFAGIPNVTFDYYDVSGRTPAEIRRAMDEARRAARRDVEAYDARNDWLFTWEFPGDGQGGCDVSAPSLTFSARVLLPRLAGEEQVPAPVLRRWRRYMDALRRHEAGHVRHAWERRSEVLAAIEAAETCEEATSLAQAAIGRIAQHDAEFDRATDHGMREGAVFP